jgi:hypothetical protein
VLPIGTSGVEHVYEIALAFLENLKGGRSLRSPLGLREAELLPIQVKA